MNHYPRGLTSSRRFSNVPAHASRHLRLPVTSGFIQAVTIVCLGMVHPLLAAGADADFLSAIRERFQERHYGVENVFLSGTDLWIEGDIQPRGTEAARSAFHSATDPTAKLQQVDAIARALLTDEGDVLGIDPHEELRRVSGDATSSLLTVSGAYERYLGGLRLDNSRVVVVVNVDGDIRHVGMLLIHISDALRAAVSARHLSEADIAAVAKKNGGPTPYYCPALRRMSATDRDGTCTLGTFEKIAVAAPPYVLWSVRTGALISRINAFTGDVIERHSTLHLDP